MSLKRYVFRRVSPCFVPKQGTLNCDPTYELEERIIESSPLFKHYKKNHRFFRQKNAQRQKIKFKKGSPDQLNNNRLDLASLPKENNSADIFTDIFLTYNRFKDAAKCMEISEATDFNGTSSPNNRILQINDSITSISTNCSFGTRKLVKCGRIK